MCPSSKPLVSQTRRRPRPGSRRTRQTAGEEGRFSLVRTLGGLRRREPKPRWSPLARSRGLETYRAIPDDRSERRQQLSASFMGPAAVNYAPDGRIIVLDGGAIRIIK